MCIHVCTMYSEVSIEIVLQLTLSTSKYCKQSGIKIKLQLSLVFGDALKKVGTAKSINWESVMWSVKLKMFSGSPSSQPFSRKKT